MEWEGGRGVVGAIFKGEDESSVTDGKIITVSSQASWSWPVNHISASSRSQNQVHEEVGEAVALSLLQLMKGPERQTEATVLTPPCFLGASPSPEMCALSLCLKLGASVQIATSFITLSLIDLDIFVEMIFRY